MSDRDIEDIYPLSPMQQGMLFHGLYEVGTGVYLEQVSCTLVGRLNAQALQRAWNEVVKRHTILRTGFIWEELDEPLQVVFRDVTLPIYQEDWRERDPEQQLNAFEVTLQNDVEEGFDLSAAPLMRLHLIRTENEVHKLIWTHHHLLLDGWSMPLLLNEVFSLYEALDQGKNLYLPPPRPFRDYIAWLKRQDLLAAETYWRSSLAGIRAPTKISLEHQPGRDQSRVMIESVRLSSERSNQLRTLAHKLGITLNTWTQGAWALLLSRYSREKDVLFGATVAGRPVEIPGAETMLGLFINTLPVRVAIDPQKSVVEWLKSLQAQQAAGREYEYSPLVQVHAWSEVPPGESLFESILVFENYPVEESMREQRGSLQIKDLRHHGKTNYPFTVVVAPGAQLEVQIVFDRSDFPEAAVQRLLIHLRQLLENMIDGPELPLKSIKMLSDEEEKMLLFQWNQFPIGDAPPLESQPSTIHAAIRKQVDRDPNRTALLQIALNGQHSSMTYRALDDRSTKLAEYLAKIGVKAGDLVGISIERSMDMIIGLLGVLKAGAAYIPLDPKYPADRLSYMIQDARIKILLTQADLQEILKENLGESLSAVRLICLDQDWVEIEDLAVTEDEDKSHDDAIIDRAAYVIYTSGTTGLPKGVIVKHRSLVNHAFSLADIMEIGPATRLAQWISLSFDAAAEEIYPVLVSGGTLVLPAPDLELTGMNILSFCDQEAITVLHLPVPLWHACVDDMQLHRLPIPPSLQVTLVGGESPSPERLKIWSQASEKEMLFINGYGPTEATIATTVYKMTLGGQAGQLVEDEQVAGNYRIPIGRQIPNVRVFLLDEDMQTVPVGLPGEIYIGGAGLAMGYLNQPQLTREKFVPNPFTEFFSAPEQEEPRIYRTGDLGRYREDGNIEFLGRADNQVKVRGYRVELEEIEAILRLAPEIEEAAVILRGDQADHKQLVCYLVLRNSHPVVTSSPELSAIEQPVPVMVEPVVDFKVVIAHIRRMIRDKLPEFMIPSVFIILKEMPRMPNGKINRRYLASLDDSEGAIIPGAGIDYLGPRDAVEEIIAGLWQEILGIPAPGIFDNFFDLGGHSLKATQLLSRLRQVFQVEISLRSLFEALTIAGMADVVRVAVHGEQPLVPIPMIYRDEQTGIPAEPIPVSFSQQRLWFLDQLDPTNLSYNIPAAVRIKGSLDLDVLGQCFDELVIRHEALRTTFSTARDYPVQLIHMPSAVPMIVNTLEELVESVQKQTSQDMLIQNWIEKQVQEPFNLSTGPLFRVALLKIHPEDNILVVTIHHIVSDGWSLGVLIKEIAGIYQIISSGEKISLPQPSIQYADYAAWQRSWLSGDELERQMAYWKESLAGMPPTLDLPTDRPRPALKTSHGAQLGFSFSEELSNKIQTLARQEGVTVYMLLLAAFQTLLYRYTGQEDISVGSAIANRTRPEVQDVIGFFVNTLVLRTDLSGTPPFRELLQRVRETCLGAFAHQDLPFEMLVEALQPQRNLSYTPLFQVGFDLQEAAVKTLELTGITIQPLSAHSGAAAFDMLMSVNQSPGQLGGALEFNTDLFDLSTIERMLVHFEQIMLSIVADPETLISELALLSKAELNQLLVGWNNSQAEFPLESCVHHLFEAFAEKQPDHLALVYRGISSSEIQTLTYGELNQRANILAHKLITWGVGPESMVGVSTERSPEMIIAIMGILKSGAAYLPLDPNYPADRLAFMLQDSQINLLITHSAVLERLGSFFEDNIFRAENRSANIDHSSHILCLDRDWAILEESARKATEGIVSQGKDGITQPGPENLAYVIYTSGSTGKPKGTLLKHRGLCNLVTWQRQAFDIDSHSRVLQFSPLSFDASVWETFMALANGATLCLADQEILANGLELVKLLKELDITTVTLPPSVLSIIPAESVSLKALPALRTVIAAGEACTHEIVARWAPGRRFFDAYGPTETTVCASAAQVSIEDPGDPRIGRPIANTELYVADANLQLVPVGVPGELLVGGVSVARGYLKRPELTAEKFIKNPYAGYLAKAGLVERATGKLYRTGDLVRYWPDGNLEFLGRIDQQVKVRGFRIELGEIESALRQYRETLQGDGGFIRRLREAAVVVREDPPGDKWLAAFIVPEVSPPVEPSTLLPPDSSESSETNLIMTLRAFLRQTLPEYMLPARFIVIDALPLSPSGKVDRRLLATQPLARASREQATVEFVAPRNEAELELCKICAELLSIPWSDEQSPIGIHDNFFELGGHSLLATQFISRIRDTFKVELPLRMLFERPTIAELGTAIEEMKQSGTGIEAPSIRTVSRDDRRMRQTTSGLKSIEGPTSKNYSSEPGAEKDRTE